jgi:hypothetical protein
MPVPVALTFAVDRRARLIPDGHAARESRDPSVLGRRARRRESPLKFELLDAYAGVNTIAIHYRSVGHKYVVEVIELNEQRHAIRGSACRGGDA